MIGLLKFVATVLGLALVAFLFAGCGDSGTPATTAAKISKTTKTSGAAGAAKPEDLVGQVVSPTDQSPKEFKTALESRRPVVITFYMSGANDDSQVQTAMSSLQSKYRGKVDFFDYLYTDSQKYGDLTTLLKVSTTPSVIIINQQSQVQRAWSGYVDPKSLEQGIVEATRQ